ncbi:hypothetical protein FE257_010109 [Aspergillus nanangensis]|uniref:FAD-binding domain-containing protein n=1 Tax=Aspergillus nanangensis TaxID=2582783 RepID=A0AAD4GSF7_ASPNN|nr:hypothetical protein FE257_010109 [Aspergillus nanangensis]
MDKGKHLNRLKHNCTAILGDACHPTLPYQAQGAAMAVEDGAMLGALLGLLNRKFQTAGVITPSKTESLLRAYEEHRKPRTTANVRAAVEIGDFYHYYDGPAQTERDQALAMVNWDSGYSKYKWADATYQQELLAYDAIQAAEATFAAWEEREIAKHSSVL